MTSVEFTAMAWAPTMPRCTQICFRWRSISVPEDRRESVVDWLAKRGMRCSVYAAQYYLEGLFEHGAADRAVELITADGKRSWKYMVESGATITWEAWDVEFKPNLDWNHAWGAAPANLLPRYVLGVQPAEPGWKRATVRPHCGGLQFARGKVPTPHGPIEIDWKQGETFELSLKLPEGTTAVVDLPAGEGSQGVFAGDSPVAAQRRGDRWELSDEVPGSVTLTVK